MGSMPALAPQELLQDATAALVHLAGNHRALLQRIAPAILVEADRLAAARLAATQTSVASAAPPQKVEKASSPSGPPAPRAELLSDMDTLLEHVRQQLGDEATEDGIVAIKQAAGDDLGA